MQVLDQRLLIESMAMDMAVLHSQSALLLRAVSGWRREAVNAAIEREHAQRHTEMWSKVNTWLQKPDGDSDRKDVLDGAMCTSKQPFAGARFTQTATQPLQASTRNQLRGVLSGIHSDEGDARDARLHDAGASDVLGLAQTFAEELEEMLDHPPRLDVHKLIDNSVQPHSQSEVPCTSHAPLKEQPADLVDTALKPPPRTSSLCDDSNFDLSSSIKTAQNIGTVPACEASPAGGSDDYLHICVGERASVQRSKQTSVGHVKSSGPQQGSIHRAIHEKLARFVNRPKSSRAVLTKAVEKLHKFSKQPAFAPAIADDSHAVDASSVEATPLKPTLKPGRHAKVVKVPKWAMPEQGNSSQQAAGGSTGATLGICAAHQALTEGYESAIGGQNDEDSDDEFAWIMHRQLPRF